MNKLTDKQIAARVKAAQTYLEQKFPGLAFCLVVAQEAGEGVQNMHSTFNVPPVMMRNMLRRFADHHEKIEKLMDYPGGNV